MSWEAAARWMDRYGMVLPTEAQWEYGARAGTKTSWWCGARPEDVLGCANLTGRVPAGSVTLGGDGPKPRIDHFSALAPVGNFRPNPFGLFDVYGNVAEWCLDGYGPYGTHRKGDGYRLDGAVHTRVLRGGSYTEDALGARSASRSLFVLEVRKGNLGFRPARNLAM